MRHRQNFGSKNCSNSVDHFYFFSSSSKQRSILLGWICAIMFALSSCLGSAARTTSKQSIRLSLWNRMNRPAAFLHHYHRRRHVEAKHDDGKPRRWPHPPTILRSFASDQDGGDVLKAQEDKESTMLSLKIPTARDTEEVGALFATILLGDCFDGEDGNMPGQSTIPEGCTIFLDGDLGAGKTAFARGFLRAATGDDDLRVTSPTYLLVNVYPILGGSLELHHMDLYRLKGDPEDFVPLNLDHVFHKHVSLIEWPQRLGSLKVPEDRLDINIQILSDGDTSNNDNVARLMRITPHGSAWQNRLKNIIDEGYLDDLVL